MHLFRLLVFALTDQRISQVIHAGQYGRDTPCPALDPVLLNSFDPSLLPAHTVHTPASWEILSLLYLVLCPTTKRNVQAAYRRHASADRLFWGGNILLVRYEGELGIGHEYLDVADAALAAVEDVLKKNLAVDTVLEIGFHFIPLNKQLYYRFVSTSSHGCQWCPVSAIL
jgi:hypothetical protein